MSSLSKLDRQRLIKLRKLAAELDIKLIAITMPTHEKAEALRATKITTELGIDVADSHISKGAFYALREANK